MTIFQRRRIPLLGSALLGATMALLPAAASGFQDNLGRGRISGTIVDEAGSPIPGAKVAVQSLTSPTRMDAVTDAKGRFAVGGMGSGAWRIAASREGYAPSSVEVNISQLKPNTPAVVTLKKLAGVDAFRADKGSQALFDEGNALFSQGRHDEAIAVFQELLAKYPEIYQVHINLGQNYLKKSEMDKARSEFRIVLDKAVPAPDGPAKDPKAAFLALSGLGEVAIQTGDLAAAQGHFKRALEINPQDQAAAYNVGEIYFSNQKIDEAIAYLETAIRIKTDWSRPYLRLGLMHLNKGDFPKAAEYLTAFIALDPKNPEVPNARAMLAAIEKIKK